LKFVLSILPATLFLPLTVHASHAILVAQSLRGTRAVAHAATKRELIAKQRPPHWTKPSIFRPPEILTEIEMIEAKAELKALQRHALEVVDPEAES
jgi:hypothetical protein